MPSHLLLLALACALSVSQVVPEAPPPRPATLYFPTRVGAKWVYLWTSDKEKDEEVVEVVAAIEQGKDGAKVITVARVGRDGNAHPVQRFEVSSRGLLWTENLFGQGLHGPGCQLKLPHKPGQKWSNGWTGLKTTLTAHGPEKVKVPAGEFECIRVEYRDERSPDPIQTRWYAVGIGEVKLKSGDLLIVLKSFDAGKE